MDKKTAVQVFSVAAIIVGLLVSYFPPTANAAAIWGLVGSFFGYAVRDLFGEDAPTVQAPVVVGVQTSQTGHALPSMMIALLMASVALLTGCAGLNSTIAAFDQKAIVDTQAANDNYVHALEAGILTVPIGAVYRHPEFLPIARAALVGQSNNPVTIFDVMPTSGVKP
jgi:hypothetical protein